jgi:hypothetical protein
MPAAAFGGAERAKGLENKPPLNVIERFVFEAFHAIRQARAAGRAGIRFSPLRATRPPPCVSVFPVAPL